jgi:hypothetical protein
MYESKPHYGCGYWRHLGMNLAYAGRWAIRCETVEDRAFEQSLRPDSKKSKAKEPAPGE